MNCPSGLVVEVEDTLVESSGSGLVVDACMNVVSVPVISEAVDPSVIGPSAEPLAVVFVVVVMFVVEDTLVELRGKGLVIGVWMNVVCLTSYGKSFPSKVHFMLAV